MRFLIVGAGGVGGYFGGRLAAAGQDVAFLVRNPHLDAIRQNGLRVDSVHGDFAVNPAKAVAAPAEAGPVDCVMLATKTWQLTDAVESLRPILTPDTTLLTLQNGVESPSRVADLAPQNHVLAGIARIFSFIEAPGHIRHLGGAASFLFGEWANPRPERTAKLLELLLAAKVRASTSEDMKAELWRKFLLVTPSGGLGAVSRAPIGVMRSMPETRALLEACMREIADVAKAAGVTLPEDVVAQSMASIDSHPPESTTSLHRDIASGRPSELEDWNGSVVRLARQYSVAAPTHNFLYSALLPLERRARGAVQFD